MDRRYHGFVPANLSPEYKAAEAAFREAREPRERLECLREMLRTIPKHKGTERLQADIKARIKDLTEELEGGARKAGGRSSQPSIVVRAEGAAQIALIGPPNTGKSSLHVRLTGSNAHVAPYPFTTQYPEPGMMPHADVHLQLVDLPAIAREHPVGWIGEALHGADAALLVVDLTEPACLEQVQEAIAILAAKRVTLTDRWERPVGDDDLFARTLPTLMLANKSDLVGDPEGELGTFRELGDFAFPAFAVSATTGRNLGEIGPFLFEKLGLVRIYTKAPGHAPDKGKPFTLRRGQTIDDLARLIHKDMVRSLKYARVWGHSSFDGQHVGHDHVLADGDVVELHA